MGGCNDDQTSVSSQSYDHEFKQVKKRLSKLTINGASTNSLLQSETEEHAYKSPRSQKSIGQHPMLKKRRYRQLERHDIFDNINDEFEDYPAIDEFK